MAALLTAFGTMLIPIAIVLRLEQGKPSIAVYLFIVIGFISFGMGLIEVWQERKRDIKEKRLFAELILSIQETLIEISKELRGDKYERNNRDKK